MVGCWWELILPAGAPREEERPRTRMRKKQEIGSLGDKKEGKRKREKEGRGAGRDYSLLLLHFDHFDILCS